MINDIIKLSIIVLSLDSIFLYLIKDLFNTQIYDVQGSAIKINYIGFVLSYVCIIGLLYKFIIKEKKNFKDAFILGLLSYGMYEYTTLALLKNWRIKTTIIDSIWGGILFALSAYLYNKIVV